MIPIAGIVLCGGHSRRMGLSKASLPFGPETMLARTVRILSTVASPIVVVAAAEEDENAEAGSAVPADKTSVRDRIQVQDARPDQGPLEGLLAGLRALTPATQAVYVTSCDAPLLVPSLVVALVERLLAVDSTVDAVVPCDAAGYPQPLAAVYRPRVLLAVERLLAADIRRPMALLEAIRTLRMPAEEVRPFDPDLASLLNCNTPADYRLALQRAGLAIDPAIARLLPEAGQPPDSPPGISDFS
ncbi:molybdenum cofactor guanylyltransferase [Lignipirellula cremea]|uniref:Probable molybdenum cofactor guanylyltransferase n=1 Tax=Lignipirellula cremea TaxID=2528010 RepID=A0A518DUY4_9BACT|nr:molybdenum cofactor guanylyltransferase [Lignipirellula cremea]QDU95638.1 molybdopterin-guanine dinucleotide biosynthesis protein MobA [Lignipirellula cremea]